MEAPFRLAALATHPLSGGGQEKDGCPLPSRCARHPPPKWGWARKTWRRGAINPKPCLPLLAGGGGPRLYLNPCLPPLAGGGGPRSGGGGLKAVDACEVGIRTLSKERVPSNIKGQVNQTTHLAGRQPAAPCPMQPFQHIKHPLTGRAFHVFTACSEETPMQIESAFLRILMHCCVMGLDMNESSLA